MLAPLFRSEKVYILCSGTRPIIWTGNCEGRKVLDIGRYQHGFVARKDCLAKRDITLGLVLTPDVSCAVHTVWLVWKRFLDFPALIAIQSSILI